MGFAIGFVSGLIQMPIIATIYSVAVLIPGISVAVRRMHDVGKSGWFVLIPIYNIILACTNGNTGDNEYGEDPKADVFNGLS